MASVRHLGLFPWCFDPEQTYFKGIDLHNKAVPLWWRVKQWRLEVELVRKANTAPPQNTTFNISNDFNVTDLAKNILTTDTFQNEKDLVCAGVVYDAEAGEQYRLPADHLWGIDAPGIFIDSFVRIGPNFDCYFDQDDMLGARPAGTGDKVGELSVQMQGVEFTVALFRESPQTSPPALYEIVSLNGTLQGNEYWPYDPNDGGGPIYNTTTGAQIRPFPS
jgi:hypothetical protein